MKELPWAVVFPSYKIPARLKIEGEICLVYVRQGSGSAAFMIKPGSKPLQPTSQLTGMRIYPREGFVIIEEDNTGYKLDIILGHSMTKLTLRR